ncbi:MAG: hypothetical protein JHC32_02060, partial [Candidatus Aminicenantes bacterium]|nr:hypothetical protein [Candidatus Aminicenantes bacterium]
MLSTVKKAPLITLFFIILITLVPIAATSRLRSASPAPPGQPITFQTKNLKLLLSENGQLLALINPATGKNYLPAGEKAPLLQVRLANTWLQPVKATLEPKSGLLTLLYPAPASDLKATIKITPHRTHLTFRLIELSQNEAVNAVIWGPYPTTISQTIGEIVGVV